MVSTKSIFDTLAALGTGAFLAGASAGDGGSQAPASATEVSAAVTQAAEETQTAEETGAIPTKARSKTPEAAGKCGGNCKIEL